ncbi:hypothetical protein V6617_11995 [Pelagibacterium nitratireducens]|uniref:Peptidase C51 domain-containing protein n=1 Tax=Pelagibacterium nitratireducens TaxID=1046114 RepID=A0ABZ2I0G9_9HYPH|nr:hypothetical protein [Pelagibacterium sp.]
MMRIVLPLLLALCAASAIAVPASARDPQTVINVMLSELGSVRPSGCPGRWCACYLDTVLARAGLLPTGSNKARDFAHYGEQADPGAIGAIMVMSNHVGVVVGDCGNGQVQIVSGNYSNTVALGCYSPSRAIAWRAPVTH